MEGNNTFRTNGALWTYKGDTIVQGNAALSCINGNDEIPSGHASPLYTGDMYVDRNTAAGTVATLNLRNRNLYINGLKDGPSGGGSIQNSDGISMRTLNLGYCDHNGSFSGSFTGLTGTGGRGVSIYKVGAGTQIFSGDLTGGLQSITVNGGTVKLMSTCQWNVTQTASTIQVDAGGVFNISDYGAIGTAYGLSSQTAVKTIRGDGTILGKLTVAGNPTLGLYTTVAPGTSTGTLTITDIVLDNYSQMTAEVGASGAHDLLNATNSITLLSGSYLNVVAISGYTPAAGDTYDIMDWGAGGLTGTFTDMSLPDLSADLFWDASNLYVTGQISVIPEPAALSILLAALVAMGIWIATRK